MRVPRTDDLPPYLYWHSCVPLASGLNSRYVKGHSAIYRPTRSGRILSFGYKLPSDYQQLISFFYDTFFIIHSLNNGSFSIYDESFIDTNPCFFILLMLAK